MKKHFVIFVIVFLVTIGFAAANTVLDITGNINVAENIEDFKIEITNLKINNNDSKTLISKDKQSFTFTGSGNDTLEYTVTNYSYQYDANIVLTCTPSDNITVEQINNLPAQDRIKKEISSTNTNETTCKITVEKISRTDYAEDMCKYVEGTEWTFDYTGAEQEFIVPCDGNYKIELWGARGGTANSSYSIGGKGAYTSGNLSILKEKKLSIFVGGAGELYSQGWNGGGKVGAKVSQYGYQEYKAGGGGSTDIRVLSSERKTWDDFESLKSRIMVAAAGGGSAYWSDGRYFYGNGGSAGGLLGYKGTSISARPGSFAGTGGSQILAGTADSQDYKTDTAYMGGFGFGASYVTSPLCSGGGSGYYGGGAGYSSFFGAAGGGSSFISGHNGCDAIAENSTQTNIIHTGQPNHYSGFVFTDTVMVDGDGYKWTNVKVEQTGMPTHDGASTMMGNSGNGYAKITFLG